MITEETVRYLMEAYAELGNKVDTLEHRVVSLETRFGHRGRRLDMLQAEVELLAVKVYTEKPKTPRKARSDRGQKRETRRASAVHFDRAEDIRRKAKKGEKGETK
jgi:hypothetical protein